MTGRVPQAPHLSSGTFTLLKRPKAMIQVEPMTGKLRASSSKPRLGSTSAVPAFLWQSWYT